MATVAIVEDDPAILTLVVEILQSEGFDVIQSTGEDEDAVKKIEAAHPDAVVLDYQLPGMSGIEIARVIRAQPDLAGTRIIGMTAAARAPGVCREMDADTCLGKPFDLEELLAALQYP